MAKSLLKRATVLMITKKNSRLEWHLDVPVCRTLRGLATHLSLIGLGQVQQLSYELDCDGLMSLTKKMWAMEKGRRKKSA